MINYLLGIAIGSYGVICLKKKHFDEFVIIHLFGAFILLAVLI